MVYENWQDICQERGRQKEEYTKKMTDYHQDCYFLCAIPLSC